VFLLFDSSGADAFMMKPFPVDTESLKLEMSRVLFDQKRSLSISNEV
jgi:hypothetical protein